METDLLLWTADQAYGFEKSDAATYPTFDETSQRYYVPFDADDQEAIVFSGTVPEGYDSSQTLYLDIYFWMALATSGNVRFDAFVESITPGDAFDMDAGSSFDSANESAATAVPATQGHSKIITITLANKDSMAAGDMLRVCIERDGVDAGDTAASDCYLFAARLYQSTD